MELRAGTVYVVSPGWAGNKVWRTTDGNKVWRRADGAVISR